LRLLLRVIIAAYPLNWKSRRKLSRRALSPLALTDKGKAGTARLEPDAPLLRVIREYLKFTGVKFGRGIA